MQLTHRSCRSCRIGKAVADTAEFVTLRMPGHLNRANREVLLVPTFIPQQRAIASAGRLENVSDGKSDMNANRNSDESIVPAKRANKDRAEPSAELAEGRDSTKRNAKLSDLPRS